MNLARLAALHKRVKDWENGIAEHAQDAAVAETMRRELSELKQLLARCGEEKAVTPDREFEIADRERRLTSLYEEARLRVVGGAYQRSQ